MAKSRKKNQSRKKGESIQKGATVHHNSKLRPQQAKTMFFVLPDIYHVPDYRHFRDIYDVYSKMDSSEAAVVLGDIAYYENKEDDFYFSVEPKKYYQGIVVPSHMTMADLRKHPSYDAAWMSGLTKYNFDYFLPKDQQAKYKRILRKLQKGKPLKVTGLVGTLPASRKTPTGPFTGNESIGLLTAAQASAAMGRKKSLKKCRNAWCAGVMLYHELFGTGKFVPLKKKSKAYRFVKAVQTKINAHRAKGKSLHAAFQLVRKSPPKIAGLKKTRSTRGRRRRSRRS
jgi:hypothetical protein